MDKVLIITYYWPPSGGAGVQRWLKLSKYLALKNTDVHVISVNPKNASYIQHDQSLCKDVHKNIKVHLTQSFEPINYYAKLVGKSNVPISGFSNVDNDNWKLKLVNFIRSHIFIPDPRRGWNKFAYKKALEVIKEYKIKNVITTSPPHSTQLIGLRLKKVLGSSIRWISDFRDPWTDIYYYELLQHSFLSHTINKRYERKVIEQSDAIFTVGERFKSSLLSKTDAISDDKISIITNGFDPEDFLTKKRNKNSAFTISYIGTISDYYKPEVFFSALGKLIEKYPDISIQFRLIGIVTDRLKSFIQDQIGKVAMFIPTVAHDKAVDYMVSSDMLLLITQGEEGTIPGKTFEYLASERRILCIGKGDAALAISRCNAGQSFERDEEKAIFSYLEVALLDFRDKKTYKVNTQEIIKYSREYQAKQIIEACNKL